MGWPVTASSIPFWPREPSTIETPSSSASSVSFVPPLIRVLKFSLSSSPPVVTPGSSLANDTAVRVWPPRISGSSSSSFGWMVPFCTADSKLRGDALAVTSISFGGRSECERNSNTHLLVEIDRDTALDVLAKALGRDREVIGIRHQVGKRVEAVWPRGRPRHGRCAERSQTQLRAWNGRAGGILDNPRDGCSRTLRPYHAGEYDTQKQSGDNATTRPKHKKPSLVCSEDIATESFPCQAFSSVSDQNIGFGSRVFMNRFIFRKFCRILSVGRVLRSCIG